jgi:hypothetical protein
MLIAGIREREACRMAGHVIRSHGGATDGLERVAGNGLAGGFIEAPMITRASAAGLSKNLRSRPAGVIGAPIPLCCRARDV